MKKYILLILIIITFTLNTNIVLSAELGCENNSPYNTVTGKKCSKFEITNALTKTLKSGTKGDDVSKIQKFLKEKGYFTGAITGVYGNKTLYSIKKFQIDNKLNASGNFDSATLAKFNSYLIPTVDQKKEILVQPVEKKVEESKTDPFGGVDISHLYLNKDINKSRGIYTVKLTCTFIRSQTEQSCYATNVDGKSYAFKGTSIAEGFVDIYHGESLVVNSSCGNNATIRLNPENLSLFTSASFDCVNKSLIIKNDNNLGNIKLNKYYYKILEATGGDATYVWKLLKGEFPEGLYISTGGDCFTICKNSMSISGTPKTSGTYKFTIELSSGPIITTKDFIITVD